MKFCILGDAGSTLVQNFVLKMSEYFDKAQFDIISFRLSRSKLPSNTKQYIPLKQNSLISKIPKVRGIWAMIQKWKYIRKSDLFQICHIHYLDKQSALLSNVLKKRSKSIITSVWGSDFYRSSDKKRRTQEKLLKISDIITFTNQKTLKDFDHYYNKKYTDKLRVCRFGLAPLDKLKNLKIKKTNCKKGLGISPEDIVVTIGYNNSPAQQHISILKAIHNYKKQLPRNLFFLLPMTYGSTKKYTNAVRDEINKLGFKYKIFDNFMSDKEVAMLRKASDLMIQVQITDQFSGSMQEHLYTENVVITGDWLPYDTLDEKGVFMLKVSSVDEVGEKLVYALQNLDTLKDKCKRNPKIIWELSSWENNIQSWVDMYTELLYK